MKKYLIKIKHISYKISINYCSIKMQIVIHNIEKNFKYSTFSEHITIFQTLSIRI